jgi:signal transduction histidine kinase
MVGNAYWNRGLYIAKGIAEAHGDKIWANNNADGNGATFTNLLEALL